MSKPRSESKPVGVSDHAAFDRQPTMREWTFWPRSEPSRRVKTQGERYFDARELAAVLLGVASQDITDPVRVEVRQQG